MTMDFKRQIDFFDETEMFEDGKVENLSSFEMIGDDEVLFLYNNIYLYLNQESEFDRWRA